MIPLNRCDDQVVITRVIKKEAVEEIDHDNDNQSLQIG